MEQVRQRRVARRYVVLAVTLLAVLASGVVIVRPWTLCPVDWTGAARVDLSGSGDVVLDGSPFRVGGGAALDYMPRAVAPTDQVRASQHPLGITATISAPSRDALGEPEFTCLRATHGNELWAGRPRTYGTQTLADGDPPGAPLPAINEAWRLAVLSDGPEWLAGDQIGLELWATVHGRRYVFVVPPFALMKGG
jgi:hypothetical protein